MVLFDGFFTFLLIGLWVFCIIDVVTTPDTAVRNLPKLLWLLVVVILPLFGSIAWLIGGRDWSRSPRGDVLGRVGGGRRTPVPARRPSNPDDDEEFMATLRARAEEQRRARERDTDDPGAGAAG